MRTLKNNITYTLGAAFADCIVFVSGDNLKAATEILGFALRGKRTVVILNGIEIPKLAAGSSGPGGVANLTMVAQFSDRKDQATLLRAFAIVRKRMDARLWLVGDGIELELSGLASDLGVERDVKFWGFQGREAVQDVLGKTTVYCFSSRKESFGIAVLEAMAAGLPVVACDVEGVRTLITDGVTGLLARPNDPDDLARLILRCLEAPALRAQLGKAARAKAVAEFSIERCAEAYGDLVSEVVASLSRIGQETES
jgi:glycosyltransferase involved in cell wall biosynthesis